MHLNLKISTVARQSRELFQGDFQKADHHYDLPSYTGLVIILLALLSSSLFNYAFAEEASLPLQTNSVDMEGKTTTAVKKPNTFKRILGSLLGSNGSPEDTNTSSHTAQMREGLYDGVTPPPINYPSRNTRALTQKVPVENKQGNTHIFKTTPLNLFYEHPTNALVSPSMPTTEVRIIDAMQANEKTQEKSQNIQKSKKSFFSFFTKNPFKKRTNKTKHKMDLPKMGPSPTKGMLAMQQQETLQSKEQSPKKITSTGSKPLPTACFDTADNAKRERPKHCFYMLY